VKIDPNGQSKDARASVVLMKFLRARNLSIRSASEMLANSTSPLIQPHKSVILIAWYEALKWRKTFDIPAIMKEEFDEKLFGGLGCVFGKDKDGRPVT
jgi:phosphatidylinositol transfer protein SFH5